MRSFMRCIANSFDGFPYDGGVVNMGLKIPDGSVRYVIGVLKAMRTALGKGGGDAIHVVITDRDCRRPR